MKVKIKLFKYYIADTNMEIPWKLEKKTSGYI
jgi:hypothetical protein